jgi:uncharacterized protein YceK
MKHASTILTFIIIIAIALAGGCGSNRKYTKPAADQVPGAKAPVAAADASQSNPGVAGKPGQAPVSQTGPRYDPPTAAGRDRMLEDGVDPREKAEMTESALEFARKTVPNAKHIKVCFSKLYGGWYMLLFTQKGKTYSKEHLSWNSKTKEWEPIEQKKPLAPNQMEFELKGDVAGEKCFLLK